MRSMGFAQLYVPGELQELCPSLFPGRLGGGQGKRPLQLSYTAVHILKPCILTYLLGPFFSIASLNHFRREWEYFFFFKQSSA